MTHPSITTVATAAGRFIFPGTSISVNRIGFGAMQLAGPNAFGPPADLDAADAVLREAVALGVDHIDTSDYYGPHITNDLIREALHPYPTHLTIVSKLGAWRDAAGGWNLERSPDFLRKSAEAELARLQIDRIAIANLRMAGPDDDVAGPMQTMRQLQEEGLIGHIGISTVTEAQLQSPLAIAPIVCVQNHYNLVHRTDDAMIDMLAGEGIAYVPYFPLGGFAPSQSVALRKVATDLRHSVQSVALAWLLQCSPNILLIPGTSSIAHLRSNVAVAGLRLQDDALVTLNRLVDIA